MANTEQMEWVPTSLCDNPSISLPKESVPDLRYLVVMWEVIVVFWNSTQTMFTGVSRVVTDYDSSQMMIYSHMCTGQMVVAVRHCVTMEFLTPFLYVRNVGETLSAR